VKKILLLVLVLVIGAAFIALNSQTIDIATLRSAVADMNDWRQSNALVFSALFFVAYVIVTALSLPIAVWFTLAAGAILGFWHGLILVSFASTVGATIAFLAARFLLRDWVRAKLGNRVKTIEDGVARDGAFYLFTLRLIPVVPFFAVNLLMGLTQIPARTFYAVSQAGMLAGTAVFINAGTQLAEIDSIGGIVSPKLLASFALLGLFPWLARFIIAQIKRRKAYAGLTRLKSFDRNLIVIGGGAAGLVSAYIAAATKAKVTMVEAHKMGGDCLNYGCVPSKA
jgi:uncharacterized membrane protein YdjX (TVP38/TMEM64 family)